MSSELYQQVDPEDVGVSSAYLRNIDTLQERYLAENAYQGSVVLVARHGKVCYFKAFGKADEGVPMATDSIFRLASMSKVVAAVCVMQLFEQGRIGLHEPISTYLPEFADPKVAVVKDWGVTQLVTAEREITVHDLLTMTAGMTNTWWHRVFEPSVYGVVPQLLQGRRCRRRHERAGHHARGEHQDPRADAAHRAAGHDVRLLQQQRGHAVPAGRGGVRARLRHLPAAQRPRPAADARDLVLHARGPAPPDRRRVRGGPGREGDRSAAAGVGDARPGGRVQPAPHLLQRGRPASTARPPTTSASPRCC